MLSQPRPVALPHLIALMQGVGGCRGLKGAWTGGRRGGYEVLSRGREGSTLVCACICVRMCRRVLMRLHACSSMQGCKWRRVEA